MKTTTLFSFLGCVFVALLVLGCDPSATTEQAATTDPVENPVEQQPDTVTPPVEDVTQQPVETPEVNDHSISNPTCAMQCPGFHAKNGTYYLDGIIDSDFEMQATCSINESNECCMRLAGNLSSVMNVNELTLETEDGAIPTTIGDIQDGFELYDDGDANMLLMNRLKYGGIVYTLSFLRE